MPPPRDYGGWRRSRRIGLMGLGPAGTLAGLGAVTILIIIGAADARALLYAAPLAAAAAGAGLARIGGEPLAAIALRRARWRYGQARHHTSYRFPAARDLSPDFVLPGVLAPLTLLDGGDGPGGGFGLVLDRRTGCLTVTWHVIPASIWLAGRDEADGWVAGWGSWLAGLGYQPAVRWVTVTVDTAPEPGSALADRAAASLDPAAPPAAAAIMTQLIEAAPAVSADVRTRVSVTIDPQALAARPAGLAEAVAETTRIAAGLESGLGSCGVSVAGRLTAREIAGTVWAAFDPAARGHVTRVLAQGPGSDQAGQLTWDRAGPFAAEELPDRYRHDSGASITWCWHEAPRQNVTATVLARLLAPGRHVKRVSLQYRPMPSAEATRLLESEVNAAMFRAHYRRRTGRDETARDAFDSARARQAAAEEASGAGVCLISLYVTVTVTDEADLPQAAASTEAAAEASRIRLRRLDRSQAAGFAATLPCGICPASLAGHGTR